VGSSRREVHEAFGAALRYRVAVKRGAPPLRVTAFRFKDTINVAWFVLPRLAATRRSAAAERDSALDATVASRKRITALR
jgi:hypothetical protein